MSGPDDRWSRGMEDRAGSIQAPPLVGGPPTHVGGFLAPTRAPLFIPPDASGLPLVFAGSSGIASVRLGQSASWGCPGVYSRSGADDGTFGATVTYPRSGRRLMSVRGVGIGRSTRW
jgi:hypothetical protein